MRLPVACWVFSLISASVLGQASYPYVLKQFAGNDVPGDGGAATSALLVFGSLAVADPSGNLYIYDNGRFRVVNTQGVINATSAIPLTVVSDFKFAADGTLYIASSNQVFKRSPSGPLTLIAGSLDPPFSGDGSPATGAQLLGIAGIAVDSSGNVFFTENDSRVREVTTDGIIHTYAGTANRGYAGNGGQATMAELDVPMNLALDSSHDLYILDRNNSVIRVVTPGGIINNFAGTGGGGAPKPGPATSSPLGLGALFGGLVVDSANNVYVADEPNGVVDEITPGGTLSVIAGIPQSRFGPYTDGPATGTSFQNITGLSIDSSGNLFVADPGSGRIVEIQGGKIARTAAGKLHYAGDGGPATQALLNVPTLAVPDGNDSVYIADNNNFRIRKVTPDGMIHTVLGTGNPGTPIASAQSQLQNVSAVAVDAKGNLFYESDPGEPGPGQVFELTTAGSVEAVAGQGPLFTGTESGIGGPATQATLGPVTGLSDDPSGNVFIADEAGNRVLKVSTSGNISVFAGTGQSGNVPANFSGPASSIPLNLRNGGILASDAQGNVYLSDYGCTCVFSISPSGAATVVQSAGGFFNFGVAADAAGNVYAVGQVPYRISGGIAAPVAGGGTAVPADGAFATSVQFTNQRTTSNGGYSGLLAPPSEFPIGASISVDGNGDLYFPDPATGIVWKLVLDSPTELTISGGNNQTGQVGWTLPNPLQVVVNGRAGVPVPGVTLNFAVTSGSATVAASAVTDATGTATVPLTLGTSAGAVAVMASISGMPPVQFNATTIAAPASGVTCTITAAPSIASVNSATDFGGFSSFAPGSWIEIKGSNLALDTRLWAGSDFQGSNAPTGLDTSTVSIDGQAAFVDYISGVQINAQVPADSNTGPVKITVTTCAGTSSAFTGQLSSIEPGLLAPASFNISGKQYLVALFQDGITYVGNSGLIPGVPFAPAKPGDTITAYGVGFGPVTPSIAPGVVVSQSNSIPNFSLSFGTTPGTVTYAGLAPNAVGLYQFNIVVPQVADGDYQINVSVGSIQVPQTLYLTVHQ